MANNGTSQSKRAIFYGFVTSFETIPKGDGFITRATIENDNSEFIYCIWKHYDANDAQFVAKRKYVVEGVTRTKGDKRYMVQPDIDEAIEQEQIVSELSDETNDKWMSAAKIGAALAILILMFSASFFGLLTLNKEGDSSSNMAPSSNSYTEPDDEPYFSNTGTTQELTSNEPRIDEDNPFSNYDSIYDQSTESYNFDYDDLNTYFSDYGSGSLDWGTSTYSSGSETWTIDCYEYLNSCTARSSSGESARTYCYEYINSCRTSTSDGSSYNTYCYEYIDSCNTRGSDGYSSNTYCYEHLNSCTTRDNEGYSSNTYCYEHLDSCNTRGSDGSYSNTYCYSYVDSCTTTGSDGYSTFSW